MFSRADTKCERNFVPLKCSRPFGTQSCAGSGKWGSLQCGACRLKNLAVPHESPPTPQLRCSSLPSLHTGHRWHYGQVHVRQICKCALNPWHMEQPMQHWKKDTLLAFLRSPVLSCCQQLYLDTPTAVYHLAEGMKANSVTPQQVSLSSVFWAPWHLGVVKVPTLTAANCVTRWGSKHGRICPSPKRQN